MRDVIKMAGWLIGFVVSVLGVIAGIAALLERQWFVGCYFVVVWTYFSVGTGAMLGQSIKNMKGTDYQ